MQPRARRSELATPASNDRMIQRAPGSGADMVFLDLEDACAPSEKVAARAKVTAALNESDWGDVTRAVRVNALDTIWCHDDVIEVVTTAGRNLDVLIIPKACSECGVSDEIQAGTHNVFFARVHRATGTAGRPLAYFRGRKGRLKFPGPPSQLSA
jgi:hypothetical protein